MEIAMQSYVSTCGLKPYAEERDNPADHPRHHADDNQPKKRKGLLARLAKKRPTWMKSRTPKTAAASPRPASTTSALPGCVSGQIPESLKQRSFTRVAHAVRCALQVSVAASTIAPNPKSAVACGLGDEDEISTLASTSSPMSSADELKSLTSCSSPSSEATSPYLAPIFSENGAAYTRWETVLAGRQTAELTRQELEVLVLSEMPHKYRLDVWPQWFTGVSTEKEFEGLEPSSTVAVSIELDVPRTAPGALHARGRATLRRLLHAFASHRPDVGYCQGLNYVAGTFVLLGFDEATARNGFFSLVEMCCPGYHGQGLDGYCRDALVLGAFARTHLPAETGRRLKQLDVPLAALAVDHFLTLASASWPLMATARLWDLLLLHGQPALFASFLALLQLYLPETVSEEYDPGQVFRMSVIIGVTEDLDTVLKLTDDLLKTIDQDTIDRYRFSFSGVRL